MKDKYKVLDDGSVEVVNYDKDGDTSIQNYEYNDNLNEILSLENIIEYLENKSEEYKKQINEQRSFNNLLKIRNFLFAIFCAFSVIGSVLCSAGLTLGIIIPIIGSIICVPSCIYISIKDNKMKREIISKEYLLKEIEELLDKYNNELTKLIENKKNKFYEAEKNKSYKVIYLEKLKRLKNMINIYYNINYNYKKIIKYHEKGKLEDLLKKYYSEEEISLITSYLDENATDLLKRYNNIKYSSYERK